MAVIASQLVGEISIRGGSESIKIFAQMGERVDTSQKKLNQFKGQSESTGASLAGRLTGGIRTAISGFLDFGARLGQTVFGFQALGQTLVGLAGKILAPNASMEQTTTAFAQLLGGAKAANKEILSLSKMAADTPFEFPDLANSEQQLIAFQIPLKQTHPLLLAIGDALSGLGKNTPATLDQVVQVFGQMQAAGRIQTQDLMQLTSVGINGFKILADQMHVPVSRLKEMVTDGTIPAAKGIEMLRKGMEQTFGGGMAAQAKTFNGLLSTFQDNIGAAWRAFTGPLFNAAKGGLQRLGDLVSSKAFQDFATGAGAAVARVFGQIGQFAQQAGQFLQPIIGTLQSLGQNLQGLFGSINLGDLGSTFQAIGTALQPTANILAGQFKTDLQFVGDLFGQVGTWIQSTLLPALSGLVPPFQTVATAVVTNILPALATLWATGHQVAEALLKPLVGILEAIIPPVLSVGGFIGGLLAGAFQAVSPLVKGLSDVLSGLVNFFTQTEVGGDLLKAALIALAIPVGILTLAMIGLAVQGIIAFIASIPGMVMGFIAGAGGAWSMAAGVIALTWPVLAIIAIIAGLILLITHWGQVMSAVGNALGVVGKWIGDRMSDLGSVFHNVITGIGLGFSLLGATAQAVWQRIVSIFGNVGGWFREKWNGAINGVKNILSGLGSFAQGVWNGITGGLKAAFNGVLGFINNAIGAVNNVTGKVGIPPIPTIPLLARGTSFFPGGPAMLGEAGEPEVVFGPRIANISRGSRVVPVSQLQGGTHTIVINVAPAAIELDGYRFTGKLMPHVVNQLRGRGITI